MPNEAPEMKANSPNNEDSQTINLPDEELEFLSDVGDSEIKSEEQDFDLTDDSLEFIADVGDFDNGSVNEPSLEKTEELRVLKDGKPYTSEDLDVFGERMISIFRPTGQDIEEWIEHGYTDLLNKRVYPNYEKYINARKKDGEDVKEDEDKLAYMKQQSKYNLHYKLNHPWEMSKEEKDHFNNRSNAIQKFLTREKSIKPLDEKELNELVEGLYATKIKAGKIHADFHNMSEKQKMDFETEYKTHIKTYFKNLQENGLTNLVRNSHRIYAGNNKAALKAQDKIIKQWKKDTSEMNLTDDICKSMGIPTKNFDSKQKVTFQESPDFPEIPNEPESEQSSINEKTANLKANSVENESEDNKVSIQNGSEQPRDKKSDNKINKEHPDVQTLTKVDEKPSEDELLDFADKELENPKKALESLKKENQLQSQFQPGEKVVITKDNGEQQEDTVSKVEQQDLNSSPTIHTETGQTLKEDDSKIKENDSTSDQTVKHQEDFLSDKEYVQKIEKQKALSINSHKISTANNTLVNGFRDFKDYDETKEPLENMKNLIEFVGYKTTGVLKENQAGVNYLSVQMDDGTFFDYVVDKDISTKEKFKQSLVSANKQSYELANKISKSSQFEIKRLSKERLEASEYQRTHDNQTQNQSQKKNSGMTMN
jgi:hypothetical protein